MAVTCIQAAWGTSSLASNKINVHLSVEIISLVSRLPIWKNFRRKRESHVYRYDALNGNSLTKSCIERKVANATPIHCICVASD